MRVPVDPLAQGCSFDVMAHEHHDHAPGHAHAVGTGPSGAVVAVVSAAFALLSLASFFFVAH